MTVESSIFSGAQALTEAELRRTLNERGTAIRLLDGEGEPLASPPAGPLDGRFIVIGWPTTDAQTTHAADTAIAARNKDTLDQLGKSGKLGWCELAVVPFDYAAFRTKFPDELDEYEESLDPDTLQAIKASRTRYSLRSAVRPSHCAKLVDQLTGAIKQATNGTVD
jgi:hypothetical protein